MPLTRVAEDPLCSEEESIRRTAILQFASTPTEEAARAIIRALLHFLSERPDLAEELVLPLYTPPLAKVAEQPVLELLDHAEPEVRDQAAYILYRIGVRESSRPRLMRALAGDSSAWVRAYAAKSLAHLGGTEAARAIGEQIDSEATLESIGRMGEALALLGQPENAGILLEQAEQLRERQPPAGATQPELWQSTAQALALFLEALACGLDAESVAGTRDPGASADQSTYRDGSGTVQLVASDQPDGFAAVVRLADGTVVRLPQDAGAALGRLLAGP